MLRGVSSVLSYSEKREVLGWEVIGVCRLFSCVVGWIYGKIGGWNKR